MKAFLLGMSLSFSLACAAAPTTFSSTAPVDDAAPGASIATGLFKVAPGCDFTVEVGDRFNRITDAKGHSILMTLFADGRVASVEANHTRIALVYDASGLAQYAMNVRTGRILSIRSGKGPEWYASMRLQGKLPTPESIVGRICGNGTKAYYTGQDDLLQDMMDENYWIDEGWGDFSFSESWFIDRTQDCEAQKSACKDECDRTSDIAMLSCGADGLIWSAIAGPEVGGAIGLACAGAATYNKWACRSNCDARC